MTNLHLWALLFFQQQADFRATAPLVVASVTVTDRAGKPVDGLNEADFELLDDGRPRKFDADVTVQAVALVVAVQTSANAAAALTKVNRVGAMIEPLITGARGEAALVGFDDEVRVLAPFARDTSTLIAAAKALAPRGVGSRMVDAVDRSLAMLRDGPKDRRRVILLVGETRDRSSESSLSDVVTRAQRDNVSIYAVTFSPFLSQMSVKPHEAKPSGPPMNLLAIFTELARTGKENAAEALTRYTGGRLLSFVRQNALESAIAAIGEELHSQYILSFAPAADAKPEFHRIDVRVRGRSDVGVRTRPGYWLGGD